MRKIHHRTQHHYRIPEFIKGSSTIKNPLYQKMMGKLEFKQFIRELMINIYGYRLTNRAKKKFVAWVRYKTKTAKPHQYYVNLKKNQ